MSWLSVAFDDLKTFVSGLEAKNPALAAPVAEVTSQITGATPSVEALGTQLVNTAVDAVLAFVPGGATFDNLANGFIDEVIAALTAKKTAPAPVPPTA